MKRMLIKKWHMISSLVLINGFIMFGIVIPLIEKNQYYQAKTDEMQQQFNHLEKYKHYQKYHIQRYADLEKQYLALKQRWLKVKPGAFESYLRLNQRQLKLQLKSQIVESNKETEIYHYEVIQQNLIGRYEALLKYLKLLSSDELPTLLLEFELTNMEPEKQAPIISANLKFGYFKL